MELSVNPTNEGRRFWGPVPLFFSVAAVFVLLAGIFSLVQFSFPWLIAYDGSFHIKYSELLREQGFIDSLPWLQFTIHADEYRDHHLLFHYLLIPFTFGDLTLGGKIAAVCFAVALGLTLYFVYARTGVRYASLFAVLSVLASEPFIYRLSMLRVQSLSLALLLLVFYFSMRRRYWVVCLLSIVFVWYYDAYPLLLVVAGSFLVSGLLIDRELELKLFGTAVLGVLVGMILNPYFPENFASLTYNVYRTLFLDVENMKLGTEWSPYDTWQLMMNSLPAFIAFFVSVLAFPLIKDARKEEYAALLLNVAFLILTLKSRRFVEYWPVFAFLTAALLVGRRLPAKFLLPGLLLLIPLSVVNIVAAISEVKGSPSAGKYEGAAEWLRDNTEEGAIVFNADWDDFPFLFFHNHHNYYILGLDPMYMYSYDEPMYRLYQKITKGRLENPGETILDEFDASYVFLDRKHGKFRRRLKNDPYAAKVFEDDGGYVYHLREPTSAEREDTNSKKTGADPVE